VKNPIAWAYELPPSSRMKIADPIEAAIELLRKMGHTIESTQIHEGVTTVRTGNSGKWIPVTVKLKLTPSELLVLWEYSDVKRPGWFGRQVGPNWEDANRFVVGWTSRHQFKVRKISPEEWGETPAIRNPLA
jgi:hypothetical protein